MARRWQILGMALCGCLWAADAHAYEDQLTLAVGPGYAHGDELLGHGGLLDLAVGMGLDDIWTVRLRVTGLLHPEDSDGRPTVHAALVGGELLYLVDVLEWVPYVGVGVDGLVLASSGELDGGGGAHIVAGLDYLPTREWIFGLDVRTLYASSGPGQILPGVLATLSVQRVLEL